MRVLIFTAICCLVAQVVSHDVEHDEVDVARPNQPPAIDPVPQMAPRRQRNRQLHHTFKGRCDDHHDTDMDMGDMGDMETKWITMITIIQ